MTTADNKQKNYGVKAVFQKTLIKISYDGKNIFLFRTKTTPSLKFPTLSYYAYLCNGYHQLPKRKNKYFIIRER